MAGGNYLGLSPAAVSAFADVLSTAASKAEDIAADIRAASALSGLGGPATEMDALADRIRRLGGTVRSRSERLSAFRVAFPVTFVGPRPTGTLGISVGPGGFVRPPDTRHPWPIRLPGDTKHPTPVPGPTDAKHPFPVFVRPDTKHPTPVTTPPIRTSDKGADGKSDEADEGADLDEEVEYGPPRPEGAKPGTVSRPADNGKGVVWQEPGAPGNSGSVRIMDPTPAYPNGYVRFYNDHGQPIGLDGKPGPNSATHIPRNPDGTYPLPKGW